MAVTTFLKKNTIYKITGLLEAKDWPELAVTRLHSQVEWFRPKRKGVDLTKTNPQQETYKFLHLHNRATTALSLVQFTGKASPPRLREATRPRGVIAANCALHNSSRIGVN